MDEKGLESLEVWKMARELVVFVYKEILPSLPADEKWGLNSQMRRAVVSIPANIAEGYGRYYFQENIRHCYLARGSLDELFSHIVISFDIGYLSEENFRVAKQKVSDLRQTLNGYVRYLNKKKLSDADIASSRYSIENDFDTDISEMEVRVGIDNGDKEDPI